MLWFDGCSWKIDELQWKDAIGGSCRRSKGAVGRLTSFSGRMLSVVHVVVRRVRLEVSRASKRVLSTILTRNERQLHHTSVFA